MRIIYRNKAGMYSLFSYSEFAYGLSSGAGSASGEGDTKTGTEPTRVRLSGGHPLRLDLGRAPAPGAPIGQRPDGTL